MGKRPFDRLPEYCTVQRLTIGGKVSDFEFLLRLENLVELFTYSSVDTESIRRALEKLPLLKDFHLKYLNTRVEKSIENLKRYKVYVRGKEQVDTRDLNAVIQFIEQNAAEELDQMEVD